tara:strand:+ start:1606 stop:2319 length:714 start_codon:yes stop_codon:yes gene_type:complete
MDNFDLRKYLTEGRLLKEDFSITGEYEGEPVINSGEDLETYLRGIMVHANSGDDFVRKVEYGITDETSSISEEDKEKLIQFYEDNETSKGLGITMAQKYRLDSLTRMQKLEDEEGEEVNEVEIDSKSEKWDSLSDEDRETALLSAIEDPDNAQEYIDFRYEDLPSEVTSNMIFEDEDGGDIISVAKSILKDQPMAINNYLNSLRNDIRLNGSEGYIEFGDDDWVEDYEEYMADRARA